MTNNHTRTIVFVHSAGPQGGQQGSTGLITQLEAALSPDYNIIKPAMPEPENPAYEPWRARIEHELARITGEVVLIGHSLGGAVLLKSLSEQPCPVPVAGLFLVAVPYWGFDADWQRLDFTLAPDFAAHLPPLPRVHIYHTEGDDIVPIAHAQQYAENIPQAIARWLPGDDHLFTAGLPALVSDLKALQ